MQAQTDKNYCDSCSNNHIDNLKCFTLSDTNNDCECICDSSFGDIEGLSPEHIEGMVNSV